MMDLDTPGLDRGNVEAMLPLLKRHEIQVLLHAGFATKEVAERAGVSDDTVRRVAEEAAVEHTDDQAERRTRKIGRPSFGADLVRVSHACRTSRRGAADLMPT